MNVEQITDKIVVCANANWQRKQFSGDTVVLAVGLKSVNGLAKDLEGGAAEIYTVGDCVQPRKLSNAIHEGSLIARRL